MNSVDLNISLTLEEQDEFRRILSELNLADFNILIATPCYGGQVSEGYLRSMLDLTQVFCKLNIKHSVYTIANESLITRARNSIVANFLGKGCYSHLLFIDADIAFSPLAVLRLLSANKNVVGGCYPAKSINWRKLKKFIQEGGVDLESVPGKCLNYLFSPLPEKTPDGGSALKIENDFIKVDYVGTGFLLIASDVFDVLISNYPDDSYVNDVGGYGSGSGENIFWLFFDTIKDPDSGRYLSEDYAFCNKYLRCGGEIWLDMRSPLTHIGSFKFQGDIFSYVEDQLSQL